MIEHRDAKIITSSRFLTISHHDEASFTSSRLIAWNKAVTAGLNNPTAIPGIVPCRAGRLAWEARKVFQD